MWCLVVHPYHVKAVNYRVKNYLSVHRMTFLIYHHIQHKS